MRKFRIERTALGYGTHVAAEGKERSDGKVFVRWGNGEVQQYASVAEIPLQQQRAVADQVVFEGRGGADAGE